MDFLDALDQVVLLFEHQVHQQRKIFDDDGQHSKQPGKEPRKPEPGKEGLLGVEGVDDALILQGLHTALTAAPLQAQQQNTDPITYTDLYEWGLSGSANASERRRTFLRILGLPPRLSKKEIIQVLNTLYTRAALQVQLQAMK